MNKCAVKYTHKSHILKIIIFLILNNYKASYNNVY